MPVQSCRSTRSGKEAAGQGSQDHGEAAPKGSSGAGGSPARPLDLKPRSDPCQNDRQPHRPTLHHGICDRWHRPIQHPQKMGHYGDGLDRPYPQRPPPIISQGNGDNPSQGRSIEYEMQALDACIIGTRMRAVRKCIDGRCDEHRQIDRSDISLRFPSCSPGSDENDNDQEGLRKEPEHIPSDCRIAAVLASQAAFCCSASKPLTGGQYGVSVAPISRPISRSWPCTLRASPRASMRLATILLR